MILYDEFGQLLGADLESIELFGCNDIAEFKEKVSDISDFFINKEGYIHKFDHYNWIDYLNYSEEKIDKVLIKQSDSTAIDAKVIVKEIYNIIEINGSNITYMIDFANKHTVDIEEEPKIDDIAKEKEDEDISPEILEQDILEEKIELDYKDMAKELDVDENMYHELLNDFILESKNDLDLMNAYIANSNYESLLKITDKLKSICMNLKISVFLPILSSIERNVRNKSYDNIDKFLDVYKKELNVLSQNIRQI